MIYIIQEDADGILVREYLESHLCLSRRGISRLKNKSEGILLNGKRVTVRAILHTADLLSLALEDETASESILPIHLPLHILYEDDYFLIVDKPPAMPTHPSHGHFDDTLANGLAWIFQERGKPFVFRPINRLDKDTSGLVLIAKDKQTAHLLAHQMEKREIHKTYLALLTGAIQPTEGEIHTFIRRKEKSIILREATDFPMPDSDEALTYYKTISSNSEFSLVRANPHTGRTHQLRVHFSYVGHPIVGDSLYGTPSEKIGRHALHAFSLSFLHPITKEPLYWESKLPTDMQEICQKCHFSLPTEAIPSDFR